MKQHYHHFYGAGDEYSTQNIQYQLYYKDCDMWNTLIVDLIDKPPQIGSDLKDELLFLYND